MLHSKQKPDSKFVKAGITWIIVGQQTPVSLKSQPKIEWIQEIIEAADKAGIPVFLKNNLWPLFNGSQYAVPKWAFGNDSKLRQEFPKC